MENPPGKHAEATRASIEAFNRGDAAGYASHYAEDARLTGPWFPEPLMGREAIEQTTVEVITAFPDMQEEIVSLLEDGTRVALESHIEATHNGPLATPAGEVPPTGRQVSFDVFEILEFNDDGLVTEHREYMDPGAVMAQLGLSDA